jgi:hypothetical protein
MDAISAVLDELPEVVEDWPQLPESQQIGWLLDWDDLIFGGWRALTRQQDALSTEGKQQYRQLQQRLLDAAPLFTRIGRGRYVTEISS